MDSEALDAELVVSDPVELSLEPLNGGRLSAQHSILGELVACLKRGNSARPNEPVLSHFEHALKGTNGL